MVVSQHWFYPTLVHCRIYSRDVSGALAACVAEELAREIWSAWERRSAEFARATHRVRLDERPWTAPVDVYQRASWEFTRSRPIARALRDGWLLIADGGVEQASEVAWGRFFRMQQRGPHARGTRRTTK